MTVVSHRTLYRLELLHSIDLSLYILFILSYLLSPSHLLTLILRLTSQVQFSSPRRVHPTRSLRFFLAAWAFLNAANSLVHAIDGSSGTKGRGWAGRGVVLDFVGQAHTPSRLHLLLLDALIAGLQFVLILLAFGGEPPSAVANGLAAVGLVSGIDSHDYSALLGSDWENEEDEEDEDDGDGRGETGRRKSSTSRLSPHSTAVAPDHPVIDIRFRAVWREVRRGGTERARDDEDDGVRNLEEGRSAGT